MAWRSVRVGAVAVLLVAAGLRVCAALACEGNMSAVTYHWSCDSECKTQIESRHWASWEFPELKLFCVSPDQLSNLLSEADQNQSSSNFGTRAGHSNCNPPDDGEPANRPPTAPRDVAVSFVLSADYGDFKTQGFMSTVRWNIERLSRATGQEAAVRFSAVNLLQAAGSNTMAGNMFFHKNVSEERDFPSMVVWHLLNKAYPLDLVPVNGTLSLNGAIHTILREMFTTRPRDVCIIVILLPPNLEVSPVAQKYKDLLRARQCTVHFGADFGQSWHGFPNTLGVVNNWPVVIEPFRQPMTYRLHPSMPWSISSLLNRTQFREANSLALQTGGLVFNYFLFKQGFQDPTTHALQATRARFLAAEIIAEVSLGCLPVASSFPCSREKTSAGSNRYPSRGCIEPSRKQTTPARKFVRPVGKKRPPPPPPPLTTADYVLVLATTQGADKSFFHLPYLMYAIDSLVANHFPWSQKRNPWSKWNRTMFSVVSMRSNDVITGKFLTSSCSDSLQFPVECVSSAINSLGFNSSKEVMYADGYAGIMFALANMPWRKNTIRNLILLTDFSLVQGDASQGISDRSLPKILNQQKVTPHVIVPNQFYSYGERISGKPATSPGHHPTPSNTWRMYSRVAFRTSPFGTAGDVDFAFQRTDEFALESATRITGILEYHGHRIPPVYEHCVSRSNCTFTACTPSDPHFRCVRYKRKKSAYNELHFDYQQKLLDVENEFRPPQMLCNDFTAGASHLYLRGRARATVVLVTSSHAENYVIMQWLPTVITQLDEALIRAGIGYKRLHAQDGTANDYVLAAYPGGGASYTMSSWFPSASHLSEPDDHVLNELFGVAAIGSLKPSAAIGDWLAALKDVFETYQNRSLRGEHIVVIFASDLFALSSLYAEQLEGLASSFRNIHYVLPGYRLEVINGTVFFADGSNAYLNGILPLAQASNATIWNSHSIPNRRLVRGFTRRLVQSVVRQLLGRNPLRKLCYRLTCLRAADTCAHVTGFEVDYSRECISMASLNVTIKILSSPPADGAGGGGGDSQDTSKPDLNCTPTQEGPTFLEPIKKVVFDVIVLVDGGDLGQLTQGKSLHHLLRRIDTGLRRAGVGSTSAENHFYLLTAHGMLHDDGIQNIYTFGLSPTWGCERRGMPIGMVPEAITTLRRALNSTEFTLRSYHLGDILRDVEQVRPGNHKLVLLLGNNWEMWDPLAGQAIGLTSLLTPGATLATYVIGNHSSLDASDLIPTAGNPAGDNCTVEGAESRGSTDTPSGVVPVRALPWSCLRSPNHAAVAILTDLLDVLRPFRSLCQSCTCLACQDENAALRCGHGMSMECEQAAVHHPLVNASRFPVLCNKSIMDAYVQGQARRWPTSPVTLDSLSAASPELGENDQTALVIGVGIAMAVILIIIALLLIARRRRRHRRTLYLKELAPEEVLPSLRDAFRYVTTMMLAPAMDDVKFIPNSMLRFVRPLGRGQFGEVHLGLMCTRDESRQLVEEMVAIKVAKRGSYIDGELLQEYTLQRNIGEHPNVTKIILGGMFQGSACVVMEYMSGGDLHTFLRSIRGVARMAQTDNDDIDTMQLEVHEKLDICRQVALGMQFLSEHEIVHRDLAARNILVCEHPSIIGKLDVKISDLGLSRKAAMDGTYQAQVSRQLPVKWMAVESIQSGTFSQKTDVWSYGVLVWEVETCGDMPYPSIPNALLLSLLTTGQRLKKPRLCSTTAYELMTSCWDADPNQRPVFEEIARRLTEELDTMEHYITIVPPVNQLEVTLGGHSQERRGSSMQVVLERLRRQTLYGSNMFLSTSPPMDMSGDERSHGSGDEVMAASLDNPLEQQEQESPLRYVEQPIGQTPVQSQRTSIVPRSENPRPNYIIPVLIISEV